MVLLPNITFYKVNKMMLKIDPDVEVVYNFYNCVILKLVLLF